MLIKVQLNEGYKDCNIMCDTLNVNKKLTRLCKNKKSDTDKAKGSNYKHTKMLSHILCNVCLYCCKRQSHRQAAKIK